MDTIPSSSYLAMANSLVMSVGVSDSAETNSSNKGACRAIGPIIVSWFFAYSTRSTSTRSIGRQLVWIIFAAITLPSIWVSWRKRPRQIARLAEEEIELLLAEEN
jgi:hypothetical protein